MNLTLLAAIVCVAAWLGLVFVAHHGDGPVHVLWAVGVVLFARRILTGAPRFLS